MRRLFWILAALFTGIAAHSGFVLLVPQLKLNHAIARVSAATGPNRFFMLPADDQLRLFPSYPPMSVMGACAFDVSQGPVELSANLPPGFWTLTIFDSTGNVLFTVNDAQSGTGSFTVNLARAPSLIEMLKASGSDEPSDLTGWKVSTAETTGLAVIW
ncbi:MAG: hypothetical protein HY245_15825, partial [Rhizobiales bacterium]|nr:hypothetical protein [Hyphomicrobiales bacterium]